MVCTFRKQGAKPRRSYIIVTRAIGTGVVLLACESKVAMTKIAIYDFVFAQFSSGNCVVGCLSWVGYGVSDIGVT